MKVFTPEQMRAFDQTATIEYSIPSIVLMENAALRVVEFLEWKFAPLRGKRVVILCGKGNNGGDGFAIARHLANDTSRTVAGIRVKVYLAQSANELQGDALLQYEMLSQGLMDEYQEADWFFCDLAREDLNDAELEELRHADIVIDALCGTGFSGEVRGHGLRKGFLEIFAQRVLAFPQCTIVSVDVPSGLNSESGAMAHVSHRWVRADYTITFAAPKRGMFLRDGIENCGEIWVGDIGTAPTQMNQTSASCRAITREMAHRLLPHRPIDAHKGTAGRVIICGGSRGMSGAPALASTAALRVGAGLCITCVPDRVLDVFASNILEATSHALPCDDEGRLIESAADKMPDIWKGADVCALGPGLSRSEGALEFARRVARECPLPLIIDADALYALRAIADDVKNRQAPTILTPHPGEMGELMESDAKTVNENRLEIAVECAQKYNAFVVLKGARSVVAAPNGNTWFNLTGNAGMATGGSGDVLTGTIAGLLAQLKDALTATLLGVYLHGLAGDIEYSLRGNGLIAHDIADALPLAILDLQNRPEAQSINARLKKLE